MGNYYLSLFLSCMLVANMAAAQTAANMSQYMFMKPAYNPAAAGSSNGLSASALFRKQWTKVDGAPETYYLMVDNITKKNKHAYGGQLYRDAVGPINQYGIYGDYAFHINFSKAYGYLALGVRAGLSYYQTDWAALDAFQQGDITYTGTSNGNVSPNFGFGIHYQDQKISAGFSVPLVINRNVNSSLEVPLQNQYYLYFDYRIRIAEKFSLVPASMVKVSTKANAQIDLNLNLYFLNSIWVGAGYRSDKSANFLARYDFKKDRHNLSLGYAFDLGNGGYRSQTGGTHEIVLNYTLAKPEPTSVTPVF